MILSITDGIEVAEHTEPQERAEFCAEFKDAERIEGSKAYDRMVAEARAKCALMARQAE